MARDDRDLQDASAERTARRSQTDRLGGGAAPGEPMNPGWRAARTANNRTRSFQSFPSSGQEFALWLQYGGWRFLLGAILLVVIVAAFIIMTGQPADSGAGQTVEPTVNPATQPLIAQTPLPTVTPAAVTVTPAVAAATGVKFRVTGTGTEGLFLRADASTDRAPLTTIPEGAEVTIVGDDVVKPERVWKHIRTAEGLEGYASADFLKPVQ
jgi:hypothetical protein